MNRLILLVLFLISKIVSAQDYFPLAEPEKIWHKCYPIHVPGMYGSLHYQLKTDSIIVTDSTISSIIYIKGQEYPDWTIVTSMVENIFTKQVFTGGLQFDFNMGVGDTSFYGFNDTLYMTCYRIDTVLVESSLRKRFYAYQKMQGMASPISRKWVEGVGDEWWGLVLAGYNGGGWFQALSKNNIVIYQVGDCSGYPMDIENHSLESVKVYPNPAENSLTFDLPDINDRPTVFIFDLLGRKIFSAPLTNSSTTIDVHHFESGFYIWNIQDETKSTKATGRVTIGK